jgi:hypothetical protein
MSQHNRRPRRGPEPAPLHRAHVEGHKLDRWTVAELRAELPAVSIDAAKVEAVREAHRRSSPPPPPWRPLLRRSLPFASAEPVVAVPALRVVGESVQLTLDGLEHAA